MARLLREEPGRNWGRAGRECPSSGNFSRTRTGCSKEHPGAPKETNGTPSLACSPYSVELYDAATSAGQK